MEKFSVKKPFTVLVAVVMILILGFVAVTKMDTNLLPNVNTPYLMVVTVYPGASPERVESEVSDVLQNSLTVPGVSKITATSAENYSLLLMEFAEDTDMNSALVKVSNKLDQAKSDLPSTCLTPSIIEYSLNMNAFMTVAVSREGADQYELSEFIQNTLVPEVQRKGGVSSVSSSGLVEKLVQVQLNQDKIDGINAKLLELIDTQLAAARSQLESAEAQITAGRKEYEKQLKNFGNTVSNSVMSQMSTEVGAAVETVRAQAQALLESVNSLIAVVKEPEIQQALIEVRDGLQKVMDKFNETGMRDIDSLIDIVAELRTITDKLTTALQKLQERVNTETGSEGSTAEDLANEMQLQESLNVVYNTLESTIKAMDNVPQLMTEFSGALGSFSQQQLNAYMQFTEAREMLNEYEKQLEAAKAQRVFASFGRKLGPETEYLVSRDFLSGREDKELLLIRFLHLAFALGPGTVKRTGHPDVAPLYEMKKSLDWEVDKFQGFVRFEEHDGMLGAVIHPKNYILPLLRPHFCGRFPEENFMIYDAVHQAVLLQEDHKARLLELAAPLELPPSSEREQQFQALWKQFYQTLEIKARHNEKCRMTHCPKRFWADMVEMKDEF